MSLLSLKKILTENQDILTKVLSVGGGLMLNVTRDQVKLEVTLNKQLALILFLGSYLFVGLLNDLS